MKESSQKEKCEWVGDDLLLIDYHDREWGKAIHDDHRLFEFLVLEGAQAGLSWLTILKKRENYRRACSKFDPKAVAHYKEDKVQELLQNKGIVRNRLKIRATIGNARSFLKVQREFGSFDKYVWPFVDGKPIQNKWKSLTEIPGKSPESELMSEDLQRRGFKFVGPTICYAFMQAVGKVNDHTINCFRYREMQQNSL
jgi:DNA-3-methyladenine glycosylase I